MHGSLVQGATHGWADDQGWESAWWGTCANTYGEETKQLTYAHRMGLVIVPTDGHWPVYDLQGRSVLDVGGGPTSILLKCINVGRGTVVDPCTYPKWVADRYDYVGIEYEVAQGEAYHADQHYDEVWLYNVLQHVEDPIAVLRTVRRSGAVVRIFEWIDMPPTIGHPHQITEAMVVGELGPGGRTEFMDENGCNGRAFYGVFPD